ncbi:MAG: hypothetical protein WBN99_02345 [Mycobacterium sp.]
MNAPFIEIEALIESLVDVAADCVAPVGVGRLGVGHEVECLDQHSGSDRQFRAGAGQTGFGGIPLGLNLPQLCLDLGLWELVVGKQVEKSVFLGFQFLELAAERGVQFRDAVLFACQRLFEQLADLGDKLGGKVQSRVMIDDRSFDVVDREVRQIAHTVLAAAAEEVSIARAGSVGCLDEPHQPRCR